jgi:hypothetical protein
LDPCIVCGKRSGGGSDARGLKPAGRRSTRRTAGDASARAIASGPSCARGSARQPRARPGWDLDRSRRLEGACPRECFAGDARDRQAAEDSSRRDAQQADEAPSRIWADRNGHRQHPQGAHRPRSSFDRCLLGRFHRGGPHAHDRRQESGRRPRYLAGLRRDRRDLTAHLRGGPTGCGRNPLSTSGRTSS